MLSHQTKTIDIKIRAETPVSERLRIARAEKAPDVGPGYYQIDDSALNFTKKGTGASVGHKISAPLRSESRKLLKEILEATDLGPGCYNTDVERHVPVIQYRKAESKDDDKYLLRKRYFEQKAQDAREFHDDQKYADDSFIRSRTPVASFGRSQEKDARRMRSSFSLSPDSKEERIRLARLDQQGSVPTPSQLAYEVKYDAIERKSGTAVSWKAEVQARQSTKERLSRKRLVQAVVADKMEGDTARRRFYGPSLPVAWVPDKSSLVKRMTKEDDDRAASPTAEIMRMLAARNGQEDPAAHDPYTRAFLHSSYAGAMHKKPAVIHMDKDLPREEGGYLRKITPEEQEQDFIGPQLQPDWTGNDATKALLSKRSKPVTVRLDKTTGRERVKVHGKGMVEKEDFGTHQIRKDEDRVGPGEYDVLSQIEISKAKAKGGVVQFDKIVAREDAVGPRGEKPLASQQAEQDLLDDEELGMEQLDIDYATAKDAHKKKQKNQNIVLYRKDRYPEEKPRPEEQARLDHLGGSWFEGMYETLQKTKGKVVDFDRMKGRSMMDADVEEALDEELHEELGVAQEGAALDLTVDDPHPHKVNPDEKVPVFADPKKHPRFQVDRATREMHARYAAQAGLDVQDDLLHERRGVTYVDMEKMPGRLNKLDAAEETAAIDAMVYGGVDDDGAIQLGEETAQKIAEGQSALKKRVKQGVDMSKQRGRNDVVDDGDVHRQRRREEEEAGVVDDDAEIRGKYFTDDDAKPLPSGLTTKGIVAWDKQSSDTSSRQKEMKVVESVAEMGHGGEELDLAPRKDGTSGHRRIKAGLEWQKQRDDNHISAAETAHKIVHERMGLDSLLDPVEIVGLKDGTALHLDDVDPGDFKGGGFTSLSQKIARGKAAHSSNMTNIVGRSDVVQGQAMVREVMAKDFGQEVLTGVAAAAVAGDIVKIDPSDAPIVPRGKQSTSMRSGTSRFPEETTAPTKAGPTGTAGSRPGQTTRERNLLGPEVDEYDVAPRHAGRASTERLDLNVQDDAVRTSRLKAFPTMSSGTERLQARPSLQDGAVRRMDAPAGVDMAQVTNGRNDAIRRSGTDLLKLDVNDAALRREQGAANAGATSLRNSTARFPIAVGGRDETQLMDSIVGGPAAVLKLDPEDTATRNRVSNNGAALSRAATGRGSNTNIAKGQQASKTQPQPTPSQSSLRRVSSVSSTGSTRAKTPTSLATNARAKPESTMPSGAKERPASASNRASRSTTGSSQPRISSAASTSARSKQPPPPTMSPPAVSAPATARPPPSKEFLSIEEEMRKLGL